MNGKKRPGKVILITGGVRSGKSSFAEQLAAESGKKVVYLATARVEDEEMRERVNRHQKRRGPEVITVEEPMEPHLILDKEGAPDRLILLDCITLLVSNRFLADIEEHGANWDGEDIYAEEELLEDAASRTLDYVRRFAGAACDCPAELIMVTNEVGMGVVPDYPVGRIFRDLSGQANQILAMAADQLWMVVCGMPQRFK